MAQKTADSVEPFYILFRFFARVCLSEGASAAVNTCTVRSGQVKGEEGWTETGGPRKTTAAVTSSVIVLGKVQGAQVSEAQPHALHVEAVDLPLLALQQVFDTVGSLLLKGNQLLFNLQETHRGKRHPGLIYWKRHFC